MTNSQQIESGVGDDMQVRNNDATPVVTCKISFETALVTLTTWRIYLMIY